MPCTPLSGGCLITGGTTKQQKTMSIKNKNEIPSNASSLDGWAMSFLRDNELLNGRTYLSLQRENRGGGAFAAYLISDKDFPGYEWSSRSRGSVNLRWGGERVFQLRLGGWNQGEVREFSMTPSEVIEEDRRREENWQSLLNQYDWEGLE